MSKHRFRPRLEPLEDRRTPAGNVTAQVVSGSLVVTGDAQDNAVVIGQPSAGVFTVGSDDGSTTVNGQAEPVTLSGVTRDVHVSLADGNDSVRFGDFSGQTIAVARELRVDGGAGNNSVTTFDPLTVGRDFRVTNGAGFDRIDVFGGLTVGGDFSADNGDGDNSTSLTPFGGGVSVGRDVRIVNGAGSHFNVIQDATVGRDVTVDNAGDATAFSSNSFVASNSPDRLAVGGDLTFRTRAGGASNDLSNADVRGDVTFAAAGPGSRFHGVTSASVGGDLAVASAGQNTVTFSDVTVRGGLAVATAGEADEVTLQDVEVRRATGIATGAGDDTVSVDDAAFGAAFGLTTGAGDDAVRIEASGEPEHEGPAEFRGVTGVHLGDGADFLQLGSPGDLARVVRLLRPARFDGGAGDDLRDPANVDAPADRVTYVNFERTVPPPPLFPSGRYAVGDYVLAVKTADFNGDGKLDIATANQDSETVSVLLNKGDGTYHPAASYAAGRDPAGLAVADFNGDGRADLAVANNFGPNGTVSVLLNTGTGTFAPRVPFRAGTSVAVAAVAAGDLNGDGRADLVTSNRAGSEASSSVLLGNGDGTFGPATVYDLNVGPSGHIGTGIDVALGDVNNDGKLDVVAAALRGLAVLLGNGDGTLQSPVVDERGVLTGVTLADLNADGRLDLVSEANGVEVRLGNGDGTFGPSTQILAEGTLGVEVGDFNGDGKLDIVAAHFPEAGSVFLGNGDGTFREPIAFIPGPDDGPVAAGDVNGDGRLDLVVGNQESSSVTVLFNRGEWPA